MSKKIENEIFRILKENEGIIQWSELICQSKSDSEEMSRSLISLIDQKLIHSIGGGVLMSKQSIKDRLLKTIHVSESDIINIPLRWSNCSKEIMMLEITSLEQEGYIEIIERNHDHYVVKKKKDELKEAHKYLNSLGVKGGSLKERIRYLAESKSEKSDSKDLEYYFELLEIKNNYQKNKSGLWDNIRIGQNALKEGLLEILDKNVLGTLDEKLSKVYENLSCKDQDLVIAKACNLK